MQRLETARRSVWRVWVAMLAVVALSALVGVGGGCASRAGESAHPAWRPTDELTPPEPMREFRGVWVATVVNIDWPSRAGLPSGEQRREAVALLDLFADIGLNAVVLQVRPAADALYPSDLEPWSEALSGRSGVGPEPAYDPLAFWIDEAHARGLDLHVWINPFRARHFRETSPSAASRVDVAEPAIVRDHERYKWMDPSEPRARERTLAVARDLMLRYDADGLHLDDYFYPYPGGGGGFDDAAGFAAAKRADPSLTLGAWRRDHVNGLVRALRSVVREARPGVLFGISPFGIWRPGHPEGIKGFDAYEGLAADARLWLREGWVDYLAPQLYWEIESEGQPFGPLLAWWRGENRLGRHVWPGLYTSKVLADGGRDAEEIVRQIGLTRIGDAGPGHMHFSAVALAENRRGLADRLRDDVYAEPAIPPASPWLTPVDAPAPGVGVEGGRIRLTPGGATSPRRWVVQTLDASGWSTDIVPGRAGQAPLGPGAEAVAVRAEYGNGRVSPVVTLARRR